MQQTQKQAVVPSVAAPSRVLPSLALLCQLGLSHLLVAGLALVLYRWLSASGQPIATVLITLLTCALAGLLLTANLQYNLFVLARALCRLLLGQAVSEGFASARRWPLLVLFRLTAQLAQRELGDGQQASELRARLQIQTREAREAAAQEERNRIARDLHDSIKQQIFSISIGTAAVKAHMQQDPQSAREALEDIQRSTREAQTEMQALLQQLRASPLEHTSLAGALQTQAEALGYRTGAQVQVELGELPARDRLPPTTEETLFRIAQEGFANIARHARARHVWLRLFTDPEQQGLHLEIRDDGQGFDAHSAPPGMGLSNLRERARSLAGSITIESAPQQGTGIQVIVPLLDALPDPQEQERRQLEIHRALSLADGGYQLASAVIIFSILLSFLEAPWPIFLLAAAGMGYGYAQGRYYWLRVRRYLGEGVAEVRSLLRREYGLGRGVLTFLFFYAFLVAVASTHQPLNRLLLSLACLLLLILLTLVMRKRYQLTEDYYAGLPPPRRSWEVEQHYHSATRFVQIFLLAIPALLLVPFSRGVPFLSILMSPGYLADFSLLFVWIVLLTVEAQQCRRWRKEVQKVETVVQGEKSKASL